MVNKRGWMKLVEASLGIIIILTTILIISSYKNYSVDGEDISEQILPILDEIAHNPLLRESIVEYNTSENLQDPGVINKNNEIEGNISDMVKNRIRNPYLNFSIRICDPQNACGQRPYLADYEGEIYAEERIVAASFTDLNPKKIKIFVWRNYA